MKVFIQIKYLCIEAADTDSKREREGQGETTSS